MLRHSFFRHKNPPCFGHHTFAQLRKMSSLSSSPASSTVAHASPAPAAGTPLTGHQSHTRPRSGSRVDTSLSALGPDAAYVRSNVIVPNYADFARKIDAFTRGGAHRCFFVADFDFTLSMPGGLTSWSILDANPALPIEFRDECLAMAKHYFPIEASLTLTRDEKAPVLTEWFNRFHSLIAQQGLTPATVEAICSDAMPHTTPTGLVAASAVQRAAAATDGSVGVSDSTQSTAAALFPRLPLPTVPADSAHTLCKRSPGVMTMRDHFHELFSELKAADVPTVVVSAGIGTFIVDALRRHGISAPVPLVAETVGPLTDPRPLPGPLAVAAAARAVPGLTLDPLLPPSPAAPAASTDRGAEKLPVYVSANFPGFSPSGCVAGFLPESPIHVYNKCDVTPLTELERRLAHSRGLTSSPDVGAPTSKGEGFNVILVGDSLGDATIAGSLPAAAGVLKVGFLNLRPGVTAWLAADEEARSQLEHTCPAHSHSNTNDKPTATPPTSANSGTDDEKGSSSAPSGVAAPDGCDIPSDKASEFNPAHTTEAPMSTEHARRSPPLSRPPSRPPSPSSGPTAATGDPAPAHQLTVAEAASAAAGGHASCPACIAQVAAARLKKHCETFDVVIVDDGTLAVPLEIVRAVVSGGHAPVAAKL